MLFKTANTVNYCAIAVRDMTFLCHSNGRCVVIGKKTLPFSSAERENGDSCSLPAPRHPEEITLLSAARTGNRTMHTTRRPTARHGAGSNPGALYSPDSFASYLAIPYDDDNRKTLRHCERSEAIQCTRMDCFTAFAMTGSGFPYAMHKTIPRTVYKFAAGNICQ
jgi:hypothetical protein